MKLTYWVADRIDDNRCYSLRAKTRKEVMAMLAKENVTLKGDEYCNEDVIYA